MPDGTDLFYLEVLVSKHARKLLVKQRVRALGRLATSLTFPLVDWLRREKARSAVIKDYKGALGSLHRQFNWPYPEDHADSFLHILKQSLGRQSRSISSLVPSSQTNTTKTRRSTISLAGGERERQSLLVTTAPETSRKSRAKTWYLAQDPTRPDRNELDEIRMLVQATYSAGCFGWAMLLASMILDVQTLVAIFETSEGPTLRSSFMEVMVSHSRYACIFFLFVSGASCTN